MNQEKNLHLDQVFYLGRWVSKKHFRTFVYSEKGESKLAESHHEFLNLIKSGLWFAEKPASTKRKRDHVLKPIPNS